MQLNLSAQNYQNLAILICHLFIGGQFRILNILFSPDSIEPNILNQIELTCPNTIQWIKIDLTKTIEQPWFENQRNDHILQIIFLKMEEITNYKTILDKIFVYYRLFVFHSNLEGNATFEVKSSNNKTFESISNSMAILYNSNEVTIEAHLMHNDLTFYGNPIQVELQKNNSKKLFDEMFDYREQFRILGIFLSTNPCDPMKRELASLTDNFRHFRANFFHNQMNITFGFYQNSGFRYYCSNNPIKSRYLRHIQKPIYDELSWDAEPIDFGPE